MKPGRTPEQIQEVARLSIAAHESGSADDAKALDAYLTETEPLEPVSGVNFLIPNTHHPEAAEVRELLLQLAKADPYPNPEQLKQWAAALHRDYEAEDEDEP